MFHRLRSVHLVATLVAALPVLAVAVVPAGASKHVYRAGTFAGHTTLDGGTIELKVKRKSRGLFVRHIVVKGSFDCYGYPEDVNIDRYVSGSEANVRRLVCMTLASTRERDAN